MLDKTYIRQLFKPQIENPAFVVGLPGFGNVGKIATRLLVKFASAKPFAELYSPFFPDYVLINSEGICRAPRYEFYASSGEKRKLIILTGDTQPSLDDVIAHYGLCNEILDYAVNEYGAQLLITMGGVPVPAPKKEVYAAATSPELAEEMRQKGAIVYGKGRIMGGTGLFLGLAKKRGLKGICLLGATTGMRADKNAGLEVFKLLVKVLGNDAGEAF